MSYILDALRRADAERERGNVPGIHAQPMFAGAPQSAQRAASRPWFLALAAAALVLLVIIAALLTWKMNSGGTAPVIAASGSATSTGSVAAPANAPAAPASASSTTIAEAVAPAPAPAPPVALQLPMPSTARPPQEAAPAPRKLAKASPPAAVPAASSTGTAPAKAALPTLPSASAGEPRVYTYAELPDDIRRQVPTMTVGGSVYSPVPANRFIFVNGQVLHEGDVVAPGVVLQQIRIKAAVLTVAGYRYLMNY
jgi:general secretion pathway protein B